MNIANTVLGRVARWLEEKQLNLALEETGAVLLTTKRKIAIEISSKSKTRQLHLVKRKALRKLMPNIAGPTASKRGILASVVHFQLLYAAPVWHRVTSNTKLTRKLARIQGLASIRISNRAKKKTKSSEETDAEHRRTYGFQEGYSGQRTAFPAIACDARRASGNEQYKTRKLARIQRLASIRISNRGKKKTVRGRTRRDRQGSMREEVAR
ncbi:hypothetical protein QE152_g1999 [Popillia japonica]|uniref:Uncharacterized protein n=1 Tax=Popillia japonica TaxID=7064 RepID=A0AAW1N0E9_POPJA